MSLEFHSAEAAGIDALWKSWSGSTDAEIEATFKALDYTSFLNVIKHLRSIGLTEEPQETKLNIMVAGGLRFTLVGDGVIRDYCRDNTLKGKPFHVIKKTKKLAAPVSAAAGAATAISEIDLNEYGVRIKIRREQMMDNLHHQIVETLAKWNSLPKSFRYIKRFSFRSAKHGDIVFDASLVRENRKDARGNYVQAVTFAEAGIMKQPLHYEMEVEAKPGATQKSFLIGVTAVLRGIQRSHVLVRDSVKKRVVSALATQTGMRSGFPGSQPKTLLRSNMVIEAEPGTPNIRYGDYNVTDKADGLRCLMLADRDGRLYMIDRNLNVYGTGRRLQDADTADWAGAILDGEWVTQDAAGKAMSRYYAFDVYNGKRGEDVTGRPFYVRAAAGEAVVSRHAAMSEAVATFDRGNVTVPHIPEQHRLSIHMKTFHVPRDAANPKGIFDEAAAILERLRGSKPYHTDGLIFTPNASPLPKSGGVWEQQFKWKPATENSVDFLVVFEKERLGDTGKLTNVVDISTRFHEGTNELVRCKTLRLFVGGTRHPALEKPRDTVLMEKPFPKPSEMRTDYRPVEFAPTPPDPMAAICYVPINPGAATPGGASDAQVLASLSDTVYCASGDPIEDRTIVEMVYDPLQPAGFRWKPLRVRWDKTEQFARGKILGTLNGEGTANGVWLSIHDPVTERMICTGAVTDSAGGAGASAVTATAYYQRKAPQRDQYKVAKLADFHNNYVKQMLLRRALAVKGSSLLDMSVGQAGDIHRWMNAEAGFVLGCDIAEAGLVDPANGAYSRYLKYLINARGAVPPMIFAQADSSQRYADGSAGMTQLDRTILRCLWGESEPTVPPAVSRLRGRASMGFDAAACMFSLHYFFKDRGSLDGFLRNLAETVKVGGLFVGCCFDGDTVAALLKDVPLDGVKRGNENGTDIWTITKRYDDATGVVPPTDSGLGLGIDVNFISIGETYREYLVSFTYLTDRMQEVGFELLEPAEQEEMGLFNSTNMFEESHKMAAANGFDYPMTPAVQTFSFLNRWFIFKRRRNVGLAAAVLPRQQPAASAVAEAAAASAASAGPRLEILEEPAAAAAAPPPPPIPMIAAEEAVEEEAEAVPAGAAEEEDAAVASGPVVSVADGPIMKFTHSSAAATNKELTTLGLSDKNWRRYLSSYTPFAFHDRSNPAITYPNFEAAIAAAKYQTATNKPDLGAQLFSTTGNIHQEILEKERTLTTAGGAAKVLTNDERASLAAEEAEKIREEAQLKNIRKTGAKYTASKWEDAKERVIVDYIRQRFEGDAHFAEILAALAAKKARLVYTGVGSEMGGTVVGDAINGENLYGRALMRAVGLTY
jgi:predicted NAD-dependent protein-ADP-ribosyltransferase YbiA (DUF1768 family)